jgi:ATP-dependent Clp protease, protease subunit
VRESKLSTIVQIPNRTFKFSAAGDLELLIYGPIGEFFNGIQAIDIVRKLKQAKPRSIVMRINSNGGSFTDSVAIYNALKARHVPTTAIVEAVAASGASLIAMAADKIVMAEGSFIMIHEATVAIDGNASELRKTAQTIELFNLSMADIYANRTGQTKAKILEMMQLETWIDADLAIKLGFADSKTEAMRIAACAGLEQFARAPASLKNRELTAEDIWRKWRAPKRRQ